jgi:DNA topoisomerase-1
MRMVNDEIFQDIPQFNSITMAQNQYDLLFLFEKPEVCFTVVEYLDPSYNTIVETYTEKSKQKNKQYSLRIALFTFQGLRCCGIGLAGHLFNTKFRRSRNLPEFHYEWDITKQGIFDIISKYIPESRDFIICTDDDEEGELIGYSVLKAFGLDPYKYRRIRTYTFRNKTLFLERFTTPSYLEKGVVQSTITRHILDMIWGKNFSRLLGRGIKILSRGIHISIGRVQTPTLRFIKDRLDERESFEPKTNYYAKILFLQANGIDIEPENFIIFSNETDLTKFQEKHQFKRFYAKLINLFEEKEFADPLYNTDEALLDIEYYLKIPVSEGFEILKALYQGGIGVLSYPRTSSTNLPPGDYHSIITELAQKGWLSNINILKEKQIVIGKSAGEHPGLHPVAVPEQLSYKAKQVFQLIIRRFAATFAPPLRRRVRRFLLFPIKSVDGKDEVEYPQFKQTKLY